VSASAVELDDELEVEEVDDDALAPVAAQSSELAVVDVVVVAVCLVFVAVAVDVPSAALTVVAALSVAWTAMAPPRPSRAATLVPATILRARRAGCGRFRRGFASGIARSFVGGGRIVVRTLSMCSHRRRSR
jgi:hypothetical protein